MPTCVHGNVCRAWMKKTNSIAPLNQDCPVCAYFKPKSAESESHILFDDYVMCYDAEHDRYIAERIH